MNYDVEKINFKSYNMLMMLSMVYLCIMFINAILTNRYVGIDNCFILGGTLTSPLVFILDNIIAEIYGYKIARNLILCGYAMLSIFSLICNLVIHLPFPSFFKTNEVYSQLLGNNLLRIVYSGFIAYVIANVLNVYILVRWKILLRGKYFWLRSLGSSAFSAAIYSIIAIILMEINAIEINNILKIILMSYSIKVISIVILAYPSSILVFFIKKITKMDIYGLPQRFIPENYLKGQENY